jgi:hypothetical protein
MREPIEMKRADKEFEQGSFSALSLLFRFLFAVLEHDLERIYWRQNPICKNNLCTSFVSQKPLRGPAFHPL